MFDVVVCVVGCVSLSEGIVHGWAFVRWRGVCIWCFKGQKGIVQVCLCNSVCVCVCVGSEGQCKESSERENSHPVSLHAVAWHGRSWVHTACAHLCQEIFCSTDAQHGSHARPLQVYTHTHTHALYTHSVTTDGKGWSVGKYIMKIKVGLPYD